MSYSGRFTTEKTTDMEQIFMCCLSGVFCFALGVVVESISLRAKDREVDEKYAEWWREHRRLLEESQRKRGGNDEEKI